MPRHNTPNGRFGPTYEPPVFMRMGRRFPIEAQPEIASHSEGEFRDAISASASIGKAHLVLDIDNGMRFPFRRPRETASRNPRSDRDTVSRWGWFRKACPALGAHSGMDFPHGGSSGNCVPFCWLIPILRLQSGIHFPERRSWGNCVPFMHRSPPSSANSVNKNRLEREFQPAAKRDYVGPSTTVRLRGKNDG